MYEFECRYRRCKQIRKTYDKRRRYCNRDHQKAEGRIIRALKQSQEETDQRLSRKNARVEARMDASLNCTLHRGCLDAEKLPCLNCKKIIWQKDAWKRELEYPIYNHNSGGENKMNLPSRGSVWDVHGAAHKKSRQRKIKPNLIIGYQEQSVDSKPRLNEWESAILARNLLLPSRVQRNSPA